MSQMQGGHEGAAGEGGQELSCIYCCDYRSSRIGTLAAPMACPPTELCVNLPFERQLVSYSPMPLADLQ